MAEFNINELKSTIDKYGKTTIEEITSLILSTNSKASGALMNSLSYDITSAVNQIILNIYGDDYFKYVDLGRKPNSPKMPPISKIQKWCTYRNISETAAYPIAKKIQKNGIAGKGLIAKLLQGSKIKLEEKIEERYAELVSIALDKIILEPNK